MQERRRIWLLTNIPSPYQVELLSVVASLTEAQLDVRFMSGELPQIAENVRTVFVRMRGLGVSRTRDELRIHPQAIRECRTGDWDVYILSGTWASPTLLACAKVLAARGKPWLLWCERPHPTAAVAPWSRKWLTRGPLRAIRNRVMRRLLGSATGLLAMGRMAAREFEQLGVPSSRIKSLPYCCDIDRFQSVDPERVAELKQRREIQHRKVILFSGQMIERKGIHVLAEVMRQLVSQRSDVCFTVLGDGPLLDWLRESTASFPGRVILAGHLPQAELPVWFAAADIFFFPSRHDGWGVVINEACAAGLPIVTTYSVGAAEDLVQQNMNGFLRDRDDVTGMVNDLVRLLDSEEMRRRFGNFSLEIIQDFHITRAARSWIESVKSLISMVEPGAQERNATVARN